MQEVHGFKLHYLGGRVLDRATLVPLAEVFSARLLWPVCFLLLLPAGCAAGRGLQPLCCAATCKAYFSVSTGLQHFCVLFPTDATAVCRVCSWTKRTA